MKYKINGESPKGRWTKQDKIKRLTRRNQRILKMNLDLPPEIKKTMKRRKMKKTKGPRIFSMTQEMTILLTRYCQSF